MRTAEKRSSIICGYLLKAIWSVIAWETDLDASVPHVVKRRRKHYPLLTKPREEARNELREGWGLCLR